MKNTLATIALLLLATAAFADKQQGGCVSIMTGVDPGTGVPQLAQTFSATKVIDIDLYALFAQGKFANETHLLELRIFTPRGHVYQSIMIPFSADPAKKGTKQKVDSYPQPLPIDSLTDVTFLKGTKYLLVHSRLPVAGTPVINNSLYGNWRAEMYLDRDTSPCAPATTFAITQ